jgi:hypothetical protein
MAENIKKKQVFKCPECNTIIAVLQGGQSKTGLLCCESKMAEVTPDEAKSLTFGMWEPGTP